MPRKFYDWIVNFTFFSARDGRQGTLPINYNLPLFTLFFDIIKVEHVSHIIKVQCMLPSRYGAAITLMNLQQLKLPAQGLHKIKPAKALA